MRIGTIIKETDPKTYKKLKTMFKDQKKKDIPLGDKPERLMQHNAYIRKGRRIHQTRWE